MFLYRLLLFTVLISQRSCFSNLNLLSEALAQFQNYNAVYHFTNSQLDELEILLQTTNKMQVNYLINYDSERISKLMGNQLQLHILFLEEPYHLKNYTFVKDLDQQNVVLITSKASITKKQESALCRTEHLDKAKAVFILRIVDGKFSTCCYYCGKRKVNVRTIQSRNSAVPKLGKFFNDFNDFGGYKFKIGYDLYPPFFYRPMDGTPDFCGPESDILKAAKKLLNFKYSLIKFSGNCTYSMKDLLIEKVRLKEIHWAIAGISQTLMRTKLENLEYTRYIQFQGYMLTFEMNEDNRFVGGVVQFWYVANWPSLFLITGGVIGIALVTKLSLKLSGKVGDNFGEYAIMTVLYLVEQQSTKLRSNAKQWKPYIKLLFIFWLFSCLYLLANYKSVQAYYLMTSQTGPNDIDALIKKGYRLEIENDDYYNVKGHCQYLSSPSCTSVLDEFHVFKGDVCKSIRNVLDDKVALIQEEEPLKYTALTLCDLSPSQRQNLKFVSASIIPNEWHAWPFEKSAPYLGAFSRLFSRMESSGLLRYWYTKDIVIYNNYVNVKTQFRRENKSLSMSNLMYPFGILIVGYFVSLVILLRERRYFKCNSSV